MTLEQLGNLGEALGGVAVIVSLVYLAMQMRQNTRALRASSFQQIVDSLAEISLESAKHEDLFRITRDVASHPDAASDLDFARFGALMTSFCRRAENAHYQFEQGAVDQEAWSGIRRSILAMMQTPGARKWWMLAHPFYNPGFCRLVDTALADDATQHPRSGS
jgi:hypothetical protein